MCTLELGAHLQSQMHGSTHRCTPIFTMKITKMKLKFRWDSSKIFKLSNNLLSVIQENWSAQIKCDVVDLVILKEISAD